MADTVKLETNDSLNDEDISSKFVEVFIHFFGYIFGIISAIHTRKLHDM